MIHRTQQDIEKSFGGRKRNKFTLNVGQKCVAAAIKCRIRERTAADIIIRIENNGKTMEDEKRNKSERGNVVSADSVTETELDVDQNNLLPSAPIHLDE